MKILYLVTACISERRGMVAYSAVDPTGELAPQTPGSDAAPVIAAAEHGLLDFLNTPAHQVLGQLPLQQFPYDAPADQAPPDPAGLSPVDPMQVISPILGGLGALASGATGLTGLDPTGLITPVVNALGALGTGQFSGIDPTQMLGGVSKAFDRTATPLQQARGAVSEDWQGASGTAVDTKTRAAVANGAQVATQADGLRDNLSIAAAAVAQARTRMIDVIDEYQSTLAAIGPDIATPAGRQAAVAAANHAAKDSTAVMTELQRTLGIQADEVSKIGAPVPVTAAPEKADPKPAPAKPEPDPALSIKLPDGSTTRAPNAVAASAVRNALTQLGVRYQYGAKSPGTAFDCSGLTQWAYGKAGKDIPRVSRDQDVGASISRDNVQPGDLAVWSGHVAMIVGDGKMIEAGSPVELSPIRTTNEGMAFQGFYRPTA
jgi:cell wall-associated NlpC family hydrolase